MGPESRPQKEIEQDVFPQTDDFEIVVDGAQQPDYAFMGMEALQQSAAVHLYNVYWKLTFVPENSKDHDQTRKRKRTLDRAMEVLDFITTLYEAVPEVAEYMDRTNHDNVYYVFAYSLLDGMALIWMDEDGLKIAGAKYFKDENYKPSGEEQLERMFVAGNRIDKKAVKRFANLTEWGIYCRFLKAIDSAPSLGERLKTLFSRE